MTRPNNSGLKTRFDIIQDIIECLAYYSLSHARIKAYAIGISKREFNWNKRLLFGNVWPYDTRSESLSLDNYIKMEEKIDGLKKQLEEHSLLSTNFSNAIRSRKAWPPPSIPAIEPKHVCYLDQVDQWFEKCSIPSSSEKIANDDCKLAPILSIPKVQTIPSVSSLSSLCPAISSINYNNFIDYSDRFIQ